MVRDATGDDEVHVTTTGEELHAWLETHWDPDLTVRSWWACLADSGWSQPHWPSQWFGKGLAEREAVDVAVAIQRFGALSAPSGFGTGMAGPTLLVHGNDDQRARHLRGIVDGTDAYCQLFSEPNAGSDLAGLQCRAERAGDDWVVNGQKVWTSGGQIANKAMLLARTDVDVPKHAGLSYFLVDVRQPGVEIRPLREMTGRSFFNEVFLTDARVSGSDLIGGAGNGWRVANTTLAFERALSGGGRPEAAASPGGIAGDLDRRAGDLVRAADEGQAHAARTGQWARLAEVAARSGGAGDPLRRQQLMRLYALERVTALTSQRARALERAGAELPGLPNLAKMAQNHAIRLARDITFAELGMAGTLHAYDLAGARALDEQLGLAEHTELVAQALFAQGPPIYGGSDQIQRNIVGERVLGLPREPSTEKGIPFRDLPKN